MVGSALALLVAAGAVRAAEGRADSHFHVGNYAMQGISLRTLVDSYMGDRVSRAAVFGIPLQQKWDRFEHYEGDRIPPNYYLGPKAGMYYYGFIDAMVALEYLRLPAAARARLDPMIVGFNPMDQYGVDHVKRCLLLFPGVFTGIGEVSVHKELVGDKIGDDLIRASAAALALLPPDATDSGRNSLYNPALRVLLRFAAEAGLLVILHNDVYPAHIAPAGMILGLDPDRTHAPGLMRLCRSAPDAAVVWAHTGLGRFVRPSARHLETVSEVLDACPAWNVDRILWGSDAVAFTRNRIDEEGRAQLGSVLPVADYRRVVDMLQPLWELVGPEVARKVQGANHARLFDAARVKVRAWESVHANDDPWNLPAP
jgi:hypothetical protein